MEAREERLHAREQAAAHALGEEERRAADLARANQVDAMSSTVHLEP